MCKINGMIQGLFMTNRGNIIFYISRQDRCTLWWALHCCALCGTNFSRDLHAMPVSVHCC